MLETAPARMRRVGVPRTAEPRIGVVGAVLLLLLIASAARASDADLRQLTISPVDSVRLPSPGLRGLAFDAEGGWMLLSDHLGRAAPDSSYEATIARWERGEASALITETSAFESGLAYDGEFLWAGGCLLGQPAMLFQIDPASGQILQTLPTPGYHLGGLTFDGEHLWQIEADARALLRLETEEAKVSRRVATPGFYPTGLAYDGYHFWNADAASGRIYRLRGYDGRVDAVVSKESFLRPGKFLTLGFDGRALWVAAPSDSFAVRYSIHE
jgi:hypothetical protein